MARKKEQVEGEIQTVIEGMTDRGKETKSNRGMTESQKERQKDSGKDRTLIEGKRETEIMVMTERQIGGEIEIEG